MKKKILMFLMAICLFVPCMFFAACGQPAVVGEWEVKEVTFGEGEDAFTYDYDSYLDMKQAPAGSLSQENLMTLMMLESLMSYNLTIENDETTITFSNDYFRKQTKK